jgi:ribosomal protein S18 acetylase RimI-like enzyme
MPATRKPRERDICIRVATPADAAFVSSLLPRFVGFALPQGRRRRDVLAAIRNDVEQALREPPSDESIFIAETPTGARAGFLRLQVRRDFFSNASTCHISDLAVAKRHEGRGVGRALLAHAQTWAGTRQCACLTLGVFPGNTRARALYLRNGFAPDIIRMIKPLR